MFAPTRGSLPPATTRTDAVRGWVFGRIGTSTVATVADVPSAASGVPSAPRLELEAVLEAVGEHSKVVVAASNFEAEPPASIMTMIEDGLHGWGENKRQAPGGELAVCSTGLLQAACYKNRLDANR